MTYLELIVLISERQEKVVSDRSFIIQTDKRLYTRFPDGSWEEGNLPEVADALTLAPIIPPKEYKKKRK